MVQMLTPLRRRVWKSIDGGGTWLQLPSTDISSFDYCQDIDVHPLTGDVYVSTHFMED
jgi:hypothetical protein